MFSLRRKHDVSDEELSALIDGQLASDARERVERHIDACGACADKLSDLRSLRSTLAGLPRAAAPRSFALREADVRPAAASIERWGRAQAVMGAATAAVFIAFGVLVAVDTSPSFPSSGGDTDEAAVPTNERPAEAGRLPGASGAPTESNAFGVQDKALESATPAKSASPVAGQAESASRGEADGGDATSGATGTPCTACFQADDENELGRVPGTSAVTPTPGPPATGPAETASEDGHRWDGLRVAEAALAGSGIVCAGGLAFVWWRRRSV